MPPTILCLNAGSSSLKFALFRPGISGNDPERLAQGAIENPGPQAHLWFRDIHKGVIADGNAALAGAPESIAAVFQSLEKAGFPPPAAVGHRIVHGGAQHTRPELVSSGLLRSLRALVPFAPLHLPVQIELIEAAAAHYPGLPQVVCFDTAFHSTMPELARRLPLPRELWEQGIRHYGFHGLSYEYILHSLGEQGRRGRLIIAHLGNGASVAAVRDGAPLDTSMGLTPAGGFMMSTRSGDLDPGVLLYLLRQGRSAAQLEDMINHRSGLLGVSGISSDMKVLLDQRVDHPAAAQAVTMFANGVRKFIGAFAAVLGGLDLLVFTGGIGEHAAPVREEICRGLEFLGIDFDRESNQRNAAVITTQKSACTVRVIPTDEDLMIARHTWESLGRK